MNKETLVIGICDDNPKEAHRIRQEICKSIKLLREQEAICIVCETGKCLMECCKNQRVDLVFLSIKTPKEKGFDLAAELCATFPTTKIVFVSNHENMVFDAYEYAPLWFVRKKFIGQDITKALRKFYQNEAKMQIRCKYEGGMRDVLVYINQVLYIECKGHTLWIYTIYGGHHQLYGSLKSLEQSFCPYGFIRVHKNYMVNAKYVKEIGNRAVRMQDGAELDIGKNRRKEIKGLVESVQQGRHVSCL